MSTFTRTHHAVVANPPYIVPPTKEANEAYRARYISAHMKFGMGLPFTERLFEITKPGGFIAQITSNAFMKREHGVKLITQVLPRRDLRLVIDSQGAYIPGHGTPTCILVARNQPPTSDTVRVVGSRRGEPGIPKDHVGAVWSSILQGLGMPPVTAPNGPNPEGARFAKALTPLFKALVKDLRATDKLPAEKAATVAAAWITTAAATRAFEQRAPFFQESAVDASAHIATVCDRICYVLPCNDYFDRDAGINPCFTHTLSDAWSAKVRAEVARVVVPATTCTDWIGDVYQGLDGAVVKAHAFCQTPWFVRDLLLDLAVEPALHRFGPRATVCDPACGTGHLLVGAFRRLFTRYADPQFSGPKHTFDKCARLALSQIYGGELNPIAAALAEFRLMLAFVDATTPRHFGLVPDDLPVQIQVCDALLENRPAGYRPWPDVAKVVPVAETLAPSPLPVAASELVTVADMPRQMSLWGDR